MKLSTRARYATRILLCVSRLQGNRPVSKKIIAREEGVSTEYIGQIVAQLSKAGLVTGIRGLGGGYFLAKGAASITLFDILVATDGDMNLVGNLPEGCRCAEPCFECLWRGGSEVLRNYFSAITLGKLEADYQERIVLVDQGDYAI